MKELYKTKFDKKYIILVSLILLIAVVALVYSWIGPSPGSRYKHAKYILLPIVGIFVPYTIYSLPRITYELCENELIIHTGGMKFRTKYETMRGIHPTSSKIDHIVESKNQGALRVVTNFSNGITITLNDKKRPYVQITPKNEEKFILELQNKVPTLKRSNEPI
ncbi:PH domain-containing protein [Alkalicoccobacillus porphyridii]|uniref:Uncharacterized protein YyaB-like PH domain-containing protein n=1 Tax=Alkalicoccobacillus porphyridii TaxID=2597270 RepID=A0A553ZV87_9BACI|nr:PH domain-containing protein [Alkalicoccobacillus porphyridii]TSB45226.1 hypothetical protein FN960_17325 [Alkalicoccobacillus porphyridii]